MIADTGAEFFRAQRLPLRQLIKFIARAVRNNVVVRFQRSKFILLSDIIKGATIIIGKLLIMKLLIIFARI